MTQTAREEKAIRVQLYSHKASTLWPFGYYSRCTTTTQQAKRGWAKALPLEALHNYTSDLQIRPGQGFWVFGYPGSFFIQVYGILVLQDMGIKYLVFSKFLVWYAWACLRKNRPVILDRKIYFPYILGYSSLNLSNRKNSFCLTENAKYTFLTNFWISGRPAPAP